MTIPELKYLRRDWKEYKAGFEKPISFYKFLLNKLSARHETDQVFRCIRCGVCQPTGFARPDGIYTEFCWSCDETRRIHEV